MFVLIPHHTSSTVRWKKNSIFTEKRNKKTLRRSQLQFIVTMKKFHPPAGPFGRLSPPRRPPDITSRQRKTKKCTYIIILYCPAVFSHFSPAPVKQIGRYESNKPIKLKLLYRQSTINRKVYNESLRLIDWLNPPSVVNQSIERTYYEGSTVRKIAPRGWFPGWSKKWPNNTVFVKVITLSSLKTSFNLEVVRHRNKTTPPTHTHTHTHSHTLTHTHYLSNRRKHRTIIR